MNKKNISKELSEQIAKLEAMRDEDIDTSDIPPLDDDFWKNVRLRQPAKNKKTSDEK